MKRFLSVSVAVAVIFGMVLYASIPLVTAAESPPQYGGILKCIRGQFPKVLGNPPAMSPTDNIFTLPITERLVTWDEKGNIVPELAESWEQDPANKTIIYHLRKGVTFHDGSPFNADVVKWNFEMRKEKGRLTDGKYIESIEVIDDHTLKIKVSAFNNQLLLNYGWAQFHSRKAFEENGLEWSQTHCVGTGPFKLGEYKRDSLITYVKNDNYWRKGFPYLDGMEVRYIPDDMTAAAMMQAKEADVWQDVRGTPQVIDLEKKGFKINWGPGMFWALLPNSSDPKSPFSDKRVREAVEYALDRPAIAKMIGYGKFEPLQQMAPKNWPGFVPDYNPRPFNPKKARELLTEAGYPTGFKTTILSNANTGQDFAAAVQGYLAAVGIETRLDQADMGRYFGSVFGTGWKDLTLAASGINPDATDLFVHFGPQPMTYRTGNIKKSSEFLAICEDALHTYEKAAMIAKIKAAVQQGGDDAMITPIYRSTQANVMQPYVHSLYITIHTVHWQPHLDWMEKH